MVAIGAPGKTSRGPRLRIGATSAVTGDGQSRVAARILGAMLELFGTVQSLISWALLLAGLGIKGFAFVDALRTDAQAYPYAGKRTKGLWLAITGVALAVNIVVINPLSFLNIIGVVGALVYLVDVRPAVKQYRAGGSQQNMGPYGPW